jgi:hypothetical protein
MRLVANVNGLGLRPHGSGHTTFAKNPADHTFSSVIWLAIFGLPDKAK